MKLLGIEGSIPDEVSITQGTAVLGDDYQLLNPITGFRCALRELDRLVEDGHVTRLVPQELVPDGLDVAVVTMIRRPVVGIDDHTAPLRSARYVFALDNPMLVLLHRGWEEARAWSAEVRDTILLPALQRRPPTEEVRAIVQTGRILLHCDGALEAWRVIARGEDDPPREQLIARNRRLLGPSEAARFDAILALAQVG